MPRTIITQTRWMALALFATSCGRPTAPPVVSDPPPTQQVVTSDTIVNTPPTRTPTEPPAPSLEAGMAPTDSEMRRRFVESMLKPLWFGWYSSVAAGDPAALDRTIARNRVHTDGIAAMNTAVLGFVAIPEIDDYEFTVLEVLRDEDHCVVAALREDPRAFLTDGTVAERIGVFWPNNGRWYLATSWAIDTPEFAWDDDCTLMVRDFA